MRIFDGDAGRVAIVFPGAGYTPDRPLLHYARSILRDAGWSGRDVWWPELPPAGSDALGTMVRDIAWRELHADAAPAQRLVVAKSLGSLAAPLAADLQIPGIWLTPLMHNAEVVAGLERQTAPTLLVGGTADELWDGSAARRTGHPVLEIPGANHSLEFPGDARRSVAALGDVVEAITDFVATLDGTA
ncbi:hypothetical protein [Georgenia sp. AZ-5]|uniref:hypothetical protein n=1 Tax=Georgenia sp. AZ-5 TaxID=3367526 RepID=UPI0037547659